MLSLSRREKMSIARFGRGSVSLDDHRDDELGAEMSGIG